MNIPHHLSSRPSQQGMALAVGLLLLLVLTIIGLTAVRMTTQQSRMAANYQFQTLSFQGAEGVIRQIVDEARSQDPSVENILITAIFSATMPGAAGEEEEAGEAEGGLPEAEPEPDERLARVLELQTDHLNVSANASIRYIRQAPATGFSLGVGAGAVVAHQFEIMGSGEIPNTNARAQHQQGIERVGPGF